jgi:hypothetical protein
MEESTSLVVEMGGDGSIRVQSEGFEKLAAGKGSLFCTTW